LLGPDKAKEKVFEALSVRRVIKRGWLTALLSLYIAKRKEAKVRLKHIGDVVLQREDFGALARLTYNVAKCWPEFPEDLTRTAGSLLSPQDVLPWLRSAISSAFHLCDRSQKAHMKVLISASPEKVRLETKDFSVAFSPSCINFGAISETFIEGNYEIPEVLSDLRGREVVDVGANVGDTALYFVLNGARKVIAVEPLPSIARCAEENLKLNNVADNVKVINAALSRRPVRIPCDYDVHLSSGFSTLSSSGPCEVPGVTLGDLLKMVEDPYLLKMDCEGCEAEAILGPERERLRAFEHIVFETHTHITGVSNEKLLASLRELGFECRLHITLEPRLGQNIYHCKNSKLR
jgi:FkbM family methyltransferase